MQIREKLPQLTETKPGLEGAEPQSAEASNTGRPVVIRCSWLVPTHQVFRRWDYHEKSWSGSWMPIITTLCLRVNKCSSFPSSSEHIFQSDLPVLGGLHMRSNAEYGFNSVSDKNP